MRIGSNKLRWIEKNAGIGTFFSIWYLDACLHIYIYICIYANYPRK